MKKQTSSFSWARVAQLYQYNAPWIRKQTTIYFLISLASSLFYLFIPSETIRMTVYSTCCTILLFMFIWAPIVFTKGGDTRIIDRLIPASASEKYVFYMSYLLVIIGLACFLCPWIAERVFQVLYHGDKGGVETIKTELEIPKSFEYTQYLSTIAAMLTCFYCIVAARHNRIVKAYLISTGVLFLMSSLNTFYGIKESIMFGYKEASGLESQASETEFAEIVYSALTDHIYFLIFCMVASLLYIFLIMWLSYRSLYRRNL